MKLPGRSPRVTGTRGVNYATSPLLASPTPSWRSRFIVALVGFGYSARTIHLPFLLARPDLFGVVAVLERAAVQAQRTLGAREADVEQAPLLGQRRLLLAQHEGDHPLSDADDRDGA